MKKLVVTLAAAFITLGSASAVLAAEGQPHQAACQPQQKGCTDNSPSQNQPSKQQPAQSQPSKQQSSQMKKEPAPGKRPEIGQPGNNGMPFTPAKNSRFKKPPHGQEYRVMNDYLVLVNSKTLNIVSVLGLLESLGK